MKGINALLLISILVIVSNSGSSKTNSSSQNEADLINPSHQSVDIGNGEQTILYLPSKQITGIILTCGGNGGWGKNPGPQNQFEKLANSLHDTSIAVLQVAYKNPHSDDLEKIFKSTENDLKLSNKFIKEKLGDVKRVFIGHSMGGGVAWQSAYMNPDKTVGLVTCGQSNNNAYQDAMKNMHDMPVHILIGDKEHATPNFSSVKKHERLLKIFSQIRPHLTKQVEIGDDVVFSKSMNVGKVTKIDGAKVSVKEYAFEEGFPVKISWKEDKIVTMDSVRAPKNLWMKFLKNSTHSCETMIKYLLSKPDPDDHESSIILKMFA